MNKRLSSSKIVFGILILLVISSCVRFQREGYATMFGMIFGVYPNECAKRDITHHASYYSNGNSPGRVNIDAREFRCRIERICVGKSYAENKKCKIDAGNYWGFSEDNHLYQLMKKSDDQFDAICALNRNPWDQNFKGCSPKFRPQENYETNPYWNKETKTYILPEKIDEAEKGKNKNKND